MKQERSIKSIVIFLGSRAMFFILLFLLVTISYAVGKEYLRRHKINEEIASLNEQISKLQKKNNDLGDLITYFNTEFFAEKEARTKLNLQKPGERVMVITGENNTAASAGSETAEPEAMADTLDTPTPAAGYAEEDQSSNIIKWWNYFFKNN
jgi:cell division protein FtsB